MLAILTALCIGVVPDIDLPLHCLCASGNEILCIDRPLGRYAVLSRQAVAKRQIRPRWRRLPGAFLHADPLSPSGFALLYRRSNAGLIYANLRSGKLTESLIPAEIADSRNDVAVYVGRDPSGCPYACFGGGDGIPRMLRYDDRWKYVGNPYQIGSGHVATNEILAPIRERTGDITRLNAHVGSRQLTWRVPKNLTYGWLASIAYLYGCAPVVAAGYLERESLQGQRGRSIVVSLLESHRIVISRVSRDLGVLGGGCSVIVVDPRHLLAYDGRFRLLRLKLLWKS